MLCKVIAVLCDETVYSPLQSYATFDTRSSAYLHSLGKFGLRWLKIGNDKQISDSLRFANTNREVCYFILEHLRN